MKTLEERRQYHREYEAKNPEKMRLYRDRRRAQKREYMKGYYQSIRGTEEIRQKRRDYYAKNRDLLKERAKKYHGLYKEKTAITRRKYKLSKLYGLTVSGYDTLVVEQGGRCAICGTPAVETQWGLLAVDHDHTTGHHRGLLCGTCNAGIGYLKDDPAVVRKALEYLESYLVRTR